MPYSSMDYWYSCVVLGNQNPKFVEKIYEALKTEFPRILSVVGERSCYLQCRHCLFQEEKASTSISRINTLATAVKTISGQMQKNPMVVYEGRIFMPSHLEWLSTIRKTKTDARIGIIDNGSYLRYAEQIESSGFKFDWFDTSIDGPEKIHNLQRNSGNSFSAALSGIKEAHQILSPSGKVFSLFTLTKINYASVLDTCRLLPDEIDTWHVTSLTPIRPEISHLSVTEGEFLVSWNQLRQVSKIRPVVFRTYVAEDLLKLAKAVGKSQFFAALERATIDLSSIAFEVDGVKVIFYPQSVSTCETFLIDADSGYRVPYSLAYTLKELENGVSRFGEDLKKYTLDRVSELSNFRSLYQKCVERWEKEFGQRALQKERAVFDQIRKL